MKGLFITLEGPDGSGKSTVANLLGEYFEKLGIDCIITREPGGTQIGEKIRDIIVDNENKAMGAETEALLFAASRAQHVHEKICPSLEEGKVVVCDRFLFSSLAYQGVGRGLGVERVKMINEFGLRGVKPDLIIFFDCDPTLTILRKTKAGGDRLELLGDKFHERVYEGYKEIIKMYPENVEIVDARRPIREVYKEVVKLIDALLEKTEGLK
ncbi:dTMP kinase [Soehngenia saccharolytica]|nr:dTMP kinase [Soehngenia saccharolytica]